MTNQFLEYLVWSLTFIKFQHFPHHFRRHDHKASAFLGLLKQAEQQSSHGSRASHPESVSRTNKDMENGGKERKNMI